MLLVATSKPMELPCKFAACLAKLVGWIFHRLGILLEVPFRSSLSDSLNQQRKHLRRKIVVPIVFSQKASNWSTRKRPYWGRFIGRSKDHYTKSICSEPPVWICQWSVMVTSKNKSAKNNWNPVKFFTCNFHGKRLKVISNLWEIRENFAILTRTILYWHIWIEAGLRFKVIFSYKGQKPKRSPWCFEKKFSTISNDQLCTLRF